MILYLLKVCIYQGVFLLGYHLILRNQTFFKVNRLYLLTSLIIAFALPLIPIQNELVVIDNSPIVEWIPTANSLEEIVWIRNAENLSISNRGLENPLLLAYFFGTAFLLFRFGYNFYKTFQLKNKHELIKSTNEMKVFRIPSPQPFSFFNWVYIPSKIWNTSNFKKVLAHERQHVHQRHSYDRVLIDFITALLWINPFMYLFKKWLLEVHEFEADAAAIDHCGDKVSYQMTLLDLATVSPKSGLVSFFNFSIIKRRIMMMNQKKSTKSAILRILIVAPAIIGISILFSFRPKEVSHLNVIGSMGDIYQLLEVQESGNIPSIFPVKVEENVRVKISSGFGMRMHPIEKVKKMHKGIDIAIAKGTPVIASASGTVEYVRNDPNGYGKHILIDHKSGFKTKYGQMDSYIVKVGQLVKKGEIVGYVGSSGKSTAPHLHYEVYKEGSHVNPSDYINDYKAQ